jgi:hypothetical protein
MRRDLATGAEAGTLGSGSASKGAFPVDGGETEFRSLGGEPGRARDVVPRDEGRCHWPIPSPDDARTPWKARAPAGGAIQTVSRAGRPQEGIPPIATPTARRRRFAASRIGPSPVEQCEITNQ